MCSISYDCRIFIVESSIEFSYILRLFYDQWYSTKDSAPATCLDMCPVCDSAD